MIITKEGEGVVQLAEILAGVSMLKNGKLDTITSLITSIINEREEDDAPAPAMLLTRLPRDDETG